MVHTKGKKKKEKLSLATCNNNNTLFNEGDVTYWLPSSFQYGPP